MIIMKKSLLLLFFLLLVLPHKAQEWRIEPPSWWTGMKDPSLQIMLYGKNIGKCEIKADIPGLQLKSIVSVPNPDYQFLNLEITSEARPGDFQILVQSKGKTIHSFPFALNERKSGSAARKGFDASDMIYLIMPDRFANGDPNNDSMPGMTEKADRNAPYGRHGGDLQGIIQHLDYIAGLGATALWLNPVLENNQEHSSYHGYSITDFYRIDPRLGTNELFREMVEASHKNGLKVIMDMVMNHCGSKHWWMNNLPSPDWINQFPAFTRSNYRLSTIADPHASEYDRNLALRGWFDLTMPDLNLQNPLLLKYLIQNSIWWIEYSGIDGIRMDTYPYPDPEGMKKWASAVMREYPNFNIVGEVWFTDNAKLSYWQKKAPNLNGFNSCLPSLMDFPLTFAIHKAFNEPPDWETGLQRLYDILADDFLFPEPDNMVVFAENHDAGRVFEYLGKDVRKFRLVMAFLATVRGIPQLYYGSEILMAGDGTRGHANIRQDFPGGWPGDSVNAFTGKGITRQQKETTAFISRLFNYRKINPVLHYGKLVHFVPENNVYVYFRILNNRAVMVLLNASEEERELPMEKYNEVLNLFSSGKDVMTGKDIPDLTRLKVGAMDAKIIELN